MEYLNAVDHFGSGSWPPGGDSFRLIAIFTLSPCSASCDRRATHATTATQVTTSSALQGANNIWQIAVNTEAVAT
jgi:hypothetical protein